MKKVIIGLVIVAFFAFALAGLANQPARIATQIKDEEYNEIMEKDYEYVYPESPTAVVKAYAEIEELIYSYKFEGKREGRLEELVRKQMELLDDELIEYNGGYDKVLLTNMQSAKDLLDSGKKVIDFKYQTSGDSALDNEDNLVKFINVIYYFNAQGGDNVYRSYALRRDNNKHWKIFTYSDVDPFVIK